MPMPQISISHSNNVHRLVLLLVFQMALLTGSAQGFLKLQRDTLPAFRGIAVSADLVGAAQMILSDYGQYEAALRVNLYNQYFPVYEVGLGKASHINDEVTDISYSTKAPYFRLGVDVNLLKKKNTGNRVFAGLRYGYTNYKVDISHPPYEDPIWKWETAFDVSGEKCYQHWAELVFGIDAKVAGPLHMGWTARYRRRLFHDDGITGKTWYVPGFGIQDGTSLAATFNIIIDIK